MNTGAELVQYYVKTHN